MQGQTDLRFHPKHLNLCSEDERRSYGFVCVRITAKPGECPPQSSERRLCTSSCKSDSNCPNNEKCCSNGCGRYCTAPYTGICVILFCEWKCSAFSDGVCITAKPGRCPPQSSGRRLCTSSCKSDSNCPNNEKCCSNGCGRYCTAPYTVKPGQCPKLKNIPLCAESCFHDGQCPTTQKCCPTTSGRACSEPRGQGNGQGSGQGRSQVRGQGNGQGSGYGQGSS
uniref:WAP four-disulfide core domain 2 n=1 Tax=Sinocyclocheilus rhinocerous TaxID=307959 RepID=A0A673GY65_9TELE